MIGKTTARTRPRTSTASRHVRRTSRQALVPGREGDHLCARRPRLPPSPGGKDEHDWRFLFQKGDSDDLALVTWRRRSGCVDSDAMPQVRKLAPADADFAGLRALAAIHFRAGPLAESAAHPLRSTWPWLPAMSRWLWEIERVPRSRSPPAPTRRVVIPPATTRPRTGRADRVLPRRQAAASDCPRSVWHVDPLSLSTAPHGSELWVTIHDPSRSGFEGRLNLATDQGLATHSPVKSRANN